MAFDFDDDLAAMFDTAEFAESATYTPPGTGGVSVVCAVLFGERDENADMGFAGAARPSPVARVRVAQLAAPAEEGVLAIEFAAGPRSFKIKQAVHDDSQRRIWRLALIETA